MKKHYLMFVFAFLALISTDAQTTYQAGIYRIMINDGKYYDVTNDAISEVDPSRIMVKLKSTLSDVQRANFAARNLLVFIKSTNGGISFYKLNQNCNYIQLLTNLSSDSDIESFEVNHYYTYFDWYEPPTNDSYSILDNLLYNNPRHLWPYENTQLVEAWQYSHGDPNIIVAVLDNGLDVSHPDLGYGADSYTNLWVNNGEIPNNGIDDDNNCKIDDYNGYNFSTNSGDISHSSNRIHGTWVSSIISSKTNNSIGTFGVVGGWNSGGCKLMMLNLGNDFTAWEAIQAIEYAVIYGARVINMSWGGNYSSYLEEVILSAYKTKRVTFLAAVGNDAKNIIPFPANMAEVIAVGATEQKNYEDPETKWYDHDPNGGYYGSNYGPELDIAAPGSPLRIETIYPNLTYQFNTNIEATSFSTPFATGVVALMLSINPCLTNDTIFSILKRSADKIGGYTYIDGRCDYLGYGRINAKAAVEAILPLSSQIITSNILWNDFKSIEGNIIIEPGAELTIGVEGYILMNCYTKVIVKPGGRLIIDGGKISSVCNEMWQGIEVWGNPSLPQIPNSNQGFVNVKNGGVIENALCAIKVYRPDDRGFDHKPGGIVICNQAFFINNKTAVDIRYMPSVDNISSFTLCNFIVDNNYSLWEYLCSSDYQNPVRQIFDQHVYLRSVKGVQFHANTFHLENTTNNTYPYTGIGIYSSNSNFNILPSCIQSPCEEDPAKTNIFRGLMYGIYAINDATVDNFSVDKAKFENTYIGIYASNVHYPKILKNDFAIKASSTSSWADGRLATGLYMDACTGYHVEGNEFIGNTIQGSNNIGIYIKNSGPSTNYIYNNKIEKVSYGSIAEGWNYDQYLLKGTGLCYKCNDFKENYADINVVQSSKSVPTGIRVYQGYQGILTNDSTPAGNIFSQTAGSSHFNNGPGDHEIKYYHHETSSANIPRIWLVPIKYDNLSSYSVPRTNYLKSISCKTWIGKEIQPEEKILADYIENIFAEEQVRESILTLQDGGDSEAIINSINATPPYDGIILRDSLLKKSPYLSDTSLKVAIENEEVLNNSLLRDVLVANPHAGKSNSILLKLEERIIPMPDDMYIEILESSEIESHYNLLLENYSEYNHNKWLNFSELAEIYIKNISDPRATQKLESLVNRQNSVSSELLLVKYYMQNNQMTEALNRVALLSDRFGNLNNLVGLQDQLTGFIHIYESFIDSGFIDSTSLSQIEFTSINGEFPINVWANNFMSFISGNIQPEVYILPTLGELQNTRVKPVGNSKLTNDCLTVFPNPSKDFIIISYIIPEKNCEKSIRIWSIDGKLIDKFSIYGSANEKTFDVRDLKNGTYVVELIANEIKIASCKFQIVH